MPKFTVTISDAELKALEWDIYDIQDWIQNAISEKARRTLYEVIKAYSKFNPKKLTETEMGEIISGLELKTAKQREDEFQASIEAGTPNLETP